MKQKNLYTAPAILEVVELDVQGTLLYSSNIPFEDSHFDDVETRGQDVPEADIELSHKWE